MRRHWILPSLLALALLPSAVSGAPPGVTPIPVPVIGSCKTTPVCQSSAVTTSIVNICRWITENTNALANCGMPVGASCGQPIGVPARCATACSNLTAYENELEPELQQCTQLPLPPPKLPVTLTVTDVSPDIEWGTAPDPNSGSAGRVQALAIDPGNDGTLYAVTVDAGVWKSTDAARTWAQSSVGINNAYSGLGNYATNEMLAIDKKNSRRLLYVTSFDDARPGFPFGGLYASTDAAAHWWHVEPPGAKGGLCPKQSIYSVVFSSGQPFVASPCGLFTNTDPNFAGAWTQLASLPFSLTALPLHMAANSYGNTLFVCAGNKVYRSITLGQSWGPSVTLGNGKTTCIGVSVVPSAKSAPDTVVAVFNQAASQGGCWAACDVGLVSFQSATSRSLAFNTVATAGGSGIPAIFTAARASGNLASDQAGTDYDVFAADGWQFFRYTPSAQGVSGWTNLTGGGQRLHLDTWSMAFPAAYDPANSNCTAYTSNDSGIYENVSSQTQPGGKACDPSSGWVSAMSGLHALETYNISGVSQSAQQSGCALSDPCPTLYLANGDNDVWVVSQGGAFNGHLHEGNDAGAAYLDPAYPQQVLISVGSNLLAVSGTGGVPLNGATSTSVKPTNFTVAPAPGCNCWGPSIPTITEVMALAGEQVGAPLYFALQRPSKAPDGIVSLSFKQGSAVNWYTVETSGALGKFANDVLQLRSSGGVKNPVMWVLTGQGQVWRGNYNLVGRTVTTWQAASGTGTRIIGQAGDLFVNPYNSNFAWVSDLKSQTIKRTSDGGAHWDTDTSLTAIATNNGEYRFGCSDTLFDWTCSLAWMSFSRAHPNIVAAALFPGGVAYSNQFGQHWASLSSVTSGPTPAPANNLRGYPISVWYDDHPLQGEPSIYVALHSNRTVRVDGNFSAIPEN